MCVLVLNSFLFASDVDAQRKVRTEKQIQKIIEAEKKYAKEQAFYTADDYDFKGREVDKESLEVIKPVEVDDLDMDHVYD